MLDLSWLQLGPEWLQREPDVRWYLYLFGFGSIVLWETFWPRRTLVSPTGKRWIGQLLLMVLASVFTLWVIPVSAIEVSFRTAATGWGVLPHSGLPLALQCVIGILILDFVRFSQHWCFHASPLLWRIHRIHHSDPDFDLTTGIRFHPFDPILSIATYIPAVWFFGVPPVAAMAYELAHVVHAFFSHSNIVLPTALDAPLRLVLVTPETHRIHHSQRGDENRRNYGEMFTLWDRLLGTHREQPALGHANMKVGMRGLEGGQLWNPFRLLAWPLYDNAILPADAPQTPLDAAVSAEPRPIGQ